MPIACGNTVVMKASETRPGLHSLIGGYLIDGGLPVRVLQVSSHAADVALEGGSASPDHPLNYRIDFIGLRRVGRITAQRAAYCGNPCLLELGGKAR